MMNTKTFFLSAFILFSLPQYAGLAELPKRRGDDTNSFSKVENNAFTYGEKLEYRMPEPVIVNGRKTMNVKCSARSSRTIDALYNKVRNDYESFIDEEALIPMKYTKKIEEGKYRDSDFAMFDHVNRKINSKKGSISETPYKVQDLVSVYYWSRFWDVKDARIGDTYPTEFYMDGKVYNYNIKYLGKEVVKVDAGKFNAIKIRPQVKTGELFKSDDALTIWVSDDENHMVIKSVALSLTNYKNTKNLVRSKIK